MDRVMRLSNGDRIEVGMFTHDGPLLWIPAVVTTVADHKISVVYADGRRQDISRDKQHYRRLSNG